MFNRVFPIVATADMGRSTRFYVELLSATVMFEYPGPGGPGYVGLEIGSSHLGVVLDPVAAASGAGRISLWVDADDCDAAVARLRDAGVQVETEPTDQPWGERTATVLDPDGNTVVIAAQRPKAASGVAIDGAE